jgi:hypothetical protein
MYQKVISTQDEALSHLFFHCCFKDGAFTQEEIKTVSDKIVGAGINTGLNFTEEIQKYKSYRSAIANDVEYISYLVNLIRPINELALFSYCVELFLSDSSIETAEETLIANLAQALNIDDAEKTSIQKLMVQRKIVETEKIF